MRTAHGRPDVMADRIGDVFEVISKRRTGRHFTDAPASEEDLVRVLDAARKAPSSGNQQPWAFLVIQDPERIARDRRLGMAELMERV